MKPYLICHMCTTIDGKILGQRWGRLPGPKSSVNLFETTAASFGIGAWIVGTTTLKEFCAKPFKLKKAKTPVERVDYVATQSAKSFAIGVDTRGQTHWKSSEVQGDHVILLLTEQVGDDYLAHLKDAGVSYLFCGKREVDLHIACDKLARKFNLRKAMVQGGGKMNGSFLAAGLIDEISQVIVPIVDGGQGVSGFFDIPGDAPKKAAFHLKRQSFKVMAGGAIWVKYKVAAAIQ